MQADLSDIFSQYSFKKYYQTFHKILLNVLGIIEWNYNTEKSFAPKGEFNIYLKKNRLTTITL